MQWTKSAEVFLKSHQTPCNVKISEIRDAYFCSMTYKSIFQKKNVGTPGKSRYTHIYFSVKKREKSFLILKWKENRLHFGTKTFQFCQKNQLQTLKSAASKYQVSNVTHCYLKLELNHLYHWLMANVAEFPDGLLAEDYLNLRFARLLLSKGPRLRRRRSSSHFRPEK